MTMTNERLYTSGEVASILNLERTRPATDVRKGRLEPTDISKGRGKGGIRYMFNRKTIWDYSRLLGRHPDFSVIGEANDDEIEEDGGVVLTPENFDHIVHGEEKKDDIPSNGDVRFLRAFMESNNMATKDVAYILNKSENTVYAILGGHSRLKFEDVMALCVAAKITTVNFDLDNYFANDPERYKRLQSWVPYEKAKLMQEYAELQARMKQIEKELKAK